MYHKNVFLFLLFFLLSLRSFSAVFVVTSKADSGPGTLREALTKAAANGSATKDYINFNLTDLSEAGRTITILSNLPDISSNLVIDGSTQNGSVFGQSSAKVKVATPYMQYEDNDNGFVIFKGQGINNVELYGLYIYDFTDIVISRPALKLREGLKFTNCSNFIIGASGKGNLISGFNYYSLDLESIDNLTIQGNVIGLNKLNIIGNEGEDGGTNYGATGLISLNKCNHILLGGNLSDGNIIFTGIDLKFYQQTSSTISIRSNNFATYRDGLSTIYLFPDLYRSFVMVSTILSDDIKNDDEARAVEALVNMDLSNNLTGGSITAFSFELIKGTVSFTNNYFNVARDGVSNIQNPSTSPTDQYPINIQNCAAQFNIGANDKTKRNLFNNIWTGVAVQGDPNVFLRYNDFRCVFTAAYQNAPFAINYTLPVVTIESINAIGADTRVTGTSTPNAIIDFYSSESCQSQCSIRSYMQTVMADASGNWQADIANLNGIFYVSSTINNRTSEYKTFQVNTDNIKIKNMRCSDLATITGLKVPQGLAYYWTDENGHIVSHDLDLKINKTGKYRLVLGQGCITSDWFEIDDDRVGIYDSGLVKTDIACGSANGSIKNLYVYDPEDKISKTEWLNANGDVVGNATDIENLTAGGYTLKVSTTDGCETKYGPVILKNTTGPNIIQTSAKIQSTNCGQATGSITNIGATGTGTLKFRWTNDQQQEVGTNKDLLNQPAGTYKLQVTDDTQCGPIYTTDIVIPETNGITLDESKVQTSIASCSQNNGAITGITFSGATKFQWVDANNQVVATTADLKNAASGDYTFIASNNFGCSKTSKVYHVDQQAPVQLPQYTATIVPSCFRDNNGSVSVAIDGLVKSVRWVNSQGVTVWNGAALLNIAAGTYQLYLTDQNGCENYYNTYTVDELPEYIVADYGQHIDEQCGLKNGSITGVNITGGVPPYTYTWRNAANQTIGSGNTLTQLAAGTYILNVVDTRCGNVDITYTITDESADVAAPLVSDLQLCSSGSALLIVNNASSSVTYRLYDTQSSAHPIDEQKGGKFNITVNTNRSYFVSQLNGTCESSRAEVKVAVGLSVVNIANTFTPNGDGINDYWKIASIENYPDAVVQVFSRYGQKVYESKGYGSPFEGNLNGKKLPAGVYYYIINLKTNCNILSGSLTIIR